MPLQVSITQVLKESCKVSPVRDHKAPCGPSHPARGRHPGEMILDSGRTTPDEDKRSKHSKQRGGVFQTEVKQHGNVQRSS